MKHLLILLLAASTLGAAEPEAPTVAPNDAPVVTDPDLKEATPAMREGSDEPVGGFKDPGMKGQSGLSLGWDSGAVLGWTSWLSDRLAVKAALGVNYDEANGAFEGELREKLGLRIKTAELGRAGFAFIDLAAQAMQQHRYQEARTDMGAYVEFDITESYRNDYAGQVGVGAEIFWPGTRSVSLEALASLKAVWSFVETRTDTISQPDTAIPALSATQSSRSFQAGTEGAALTSAINIYF